MKMAKLEYLVTTPKKHCVHEEIKFWVTLVTIRFTLSCLVLSSLPLSRSAQLCRTTALSLDLYGWETHIEQSAEENTFA
jgi:hypothetical protein